MQLIMIQTSIAYQLYCSGYFSIANIIDCSLAAIAASHNYFIYCSVLILI